MNIDQLSFKIFNNSNNLSTIQEDWNNLLNYRKLIKYGLQGQRNHWLSIDQLVEINNRYDYSLNLISRYSDDSYPWVQDYRNILLEWKKENNENAKRIIKYKQDPCMKLMIWL